MQVPECQFCVPFETQPNGVARTRLFGTWANGPDQRNPGRMVIATHDHVAALRDWTDKHWIEFGQLERALERAVKEAFDPDEPRKLFNLECKMNLAAATDGPGTHTHWHLLARYRHPITITDPETGQPVRFEDSLFGRPYDFSLALDRRISPAMMKAVIGSIQKKLNLDGIEGAELLQRPL